MDAPAAPTPPPSPRRRPRRRTVAYVLGAVGLAGVLVLGAVTAVGLWWWDRARTSTVGQLDFANRLRVPPLAEPTVDAEGRLTFSLTAREGESTFRPGQTTPTLGYDGSYLGPTLRASRGDTVRVRVANETTEETTTHWHGMSLPAVADGGPHQPIAPGATWEPTWTVDQPAATLWYHPHPHERTEDQVHRGLAGLFIVDDPEASALALPQDYGVDDVPVIVQDRSFAADGRFEDTTDPIAVSGRLGDELLVNGTWNPHLPVTTERVRLRLLNASTARVYAFGLADERPFALVGTDGGLLPHPVDLERIRLSPGERAEIVVTVTPGERVVLRSFPPDLGVNPVTDRAEGGDDSFDVLELRAAADLAPSPPVPADLARPPGGDEADSVRTRRFTLDGTGQINGRRMDLGRVDARVRAGSVEVWEVTGAGIPHSFHVHDVQLRVLSVGGDDPPPELAGWKDTVYLPNTATLRLLIRFSAHSDPSTPYMFHCHLLRHEDQGMMGQLTVTEDGDGPTSIDGPPGHDHGGG